MSAADGVQVAVLVPLDPAAAFALFTDQVDAWWLRGPAFRFTPGREGTLRFEGGAGGRLVEDYGGGEAWEVGRVLAWEPGVRLCFEWRARNYAPGQHTEVEVTFVAEAAGTRVTLEHRGWDGLPPGHPARHGLEGAAFYAVIGDAWQRKLSRMRQLA